MRYMLFYHDSFLGSLRDLWPPSVENSLCEAETSDEALQIAAQRMPNARLLACQELDPPESYRFAHREWRGGMIVVEEATNP